jgi:type IV pilus assembly protein PilV
MKQHVLRRKQSFRKGRGSRGVALVEALVAILIFAFGVLGLVGLQASMTRAQSAGKFRSDASSLAGEAIGLMWADKGNMAQYASATCGAYQPCLDWKNKVASVLPGGTAVVSASATDGAVSITLTWTVPDEGTHTYVTSTAIVAN